MIRCSRFLLLFAVLAFSLFWSCGTAPPATGDTPNIPKEEKPEEALTSVEKPLEEKVADETPGEPPEFVVRAEEVIEPLDKNVDVDLAEPVYNLNEPEVAGDLEPAPLIVGGPDAAIVLDESVEKAERASAAPEAATTEPVTEGAEAEPVTAELAEEEPPQAETEDAPPPPPAAALRPSEPLIDSQPPVPKKPPEPLKAVPALPARNPPTETERYVTPVVSRTINVKTYQTFEVPFAETGWVYTGEENSKNGVTYNSRRSQGGSQVFVFRAEKEGDYTLKFYKQDFLRDYVTNEYVLVIVRDETPETAALPVSASSVEDAETPAGPPSGEIPAAPEDLLREARQAVAAQKYPDAIDLLDRMERQAALNDEAWWLYGQAFEAASPARDIRNALDAYSCIVRDYPQSIYYKNAQNRIAFINKFYFNIR
ncbi:MAG: hypothetical protein LBB47_08255 [Spirochaetaceae bacterium]|jgi:hypothetical protein|nr:hypothetical protein [Spirochaetaceae bacterium]